MSLIEVVGAAIREGGRCLVARRSATMSAPLRWEFPGGKREPGETPADALARELAEELGIEAAIGESLGVGEAPAGERRVRLEVYGARILSGEPTPTEHDELRWATADELAAFAWAEADVPIVPAVARWLRDG